jgi:hypothetical protein
MIYCIICLRLSLLLLYWFFLLLYMFMGLKMYAFYLKVWSSYYFSTRNLKAVSLLTIIFILILINFILSSCKISNFNWIVIYSVIVNIWHIDVISSLIICIGWFHLEKAVRSSLSMKRRGFS